MSVAHMSAPSCYDAIRWLHVTITHATKLPPSFFFPFCLFFVFLLPFLLLFLLLLLPISSSLDYTSFYATTPPIVAPSNGDGGSSYTHVYVPTNEQWQW
jgi:hypothetical protein